ncbi:dTMP kinase [Microvirga solisilvae]|uniref:dTMP kinase n=1 Tax=Microvirga solisilvae TaxID=2919498 RepID=UPI001FB016E7|nr:dTMP kinase [Microvirga solisilvae]
MAGRFVTFEGGEGAGKSTQIARLKERLEKLGHPVLVTREPGGSPLAEEIRSFILNGHAKPLGPFAEALMFAAARIDHLDKTIKPALKNGTTVLCDRFADSTRAYQGSSGSISSETIDELERVALAGTKPDLTFILDLPAEVGLSRAGERQARKGEAMDRFEDEGLSFHRALRQAYLAIAESDPQRCAVINADQAAEDVEMAIWAALQERLPELAEPQKRPLDVA